MNLVLELVKEEKTLRGCAFCGEWVGVREAVQPFLDQVMSDIVRPGGVIEGPR